MDNPCVGRISAGISCLIIIAFGLSIARSAEASPRLVLSNIFKDEQSLCADLRLYDAIDSDFIKSIKEGVPAILRYRIDLWKTRGIWYDRLVRSAGMTYKIEYDNWHMHYLVTHLEQEKTPIASENVADLIHHVCNQTHMRICPLELLDSLAEYYISVSAEIRLLTAEKVKEIDEWLGGKDQGGSILGIIVALFGSKPRLASIKSSEFRLDEITSLKPVQ
ncbi:MAG: DUF4390 domain-containing protein [bacterium]